MNNPSIEKIKSNFGYEKVVVDKIKIDYLKTIRFKSKKK